MTFYIQKLTVFCATNHNSTITLNHLNYLMPKSIFSSRSVSEGELLLSPFVRRPSVILSVNNFDISSETSNVRVLKLHTQNPIGV